MDELLSTHFAHLFIRDPIVIFQETLDEPAEGKSDHFEVPPPLPPAEKKKKKNHLVRLVGVKKLMAVLLCALQNLQSTNWQHMRFKPPPPGSDIGWRVEFRSMEIQLTDFENAAFAIFIVLLTRVILSYDLNLYIPISKVWQVPVTPALPSLNVDGGDDDDDG